ncbi:type I 3-dehydroquinate dehydratase [Planctomicrobium sp. SH668]|uniref:type I 3-dehydroquinate dehydratase n=1 Tax=Planctomicrobium sp. SH668 TaxID=3448126 RepID=UPI003F5C6054
MICVTVTPASRTLAKADLLNAARFGDIVELCLDHFHKEPDVNDLISAIDKPMIVSCRRPQDGGKWQGTEEERLMLLRQAIVAGPAYIELDLDIANQIPRFGSTQRVICFTRLDRPEPDIEEIFNEAAGAKADIVKFAWPTPTLEAAWPLLSAVSQKRRLPVVGMGLGHAELTFSLLGAKYGSPWIYAALEKGMEAYPGQATVFELKEAYGADEINSKTAFIAVAGFGPSQLATTRVMNAAFRQLDINAKCLPIEIGGSRHVKKMIDVLNVKAVLLHEDLDETLLGLAEHVGAVDSKIGYLNLFLKRDNGWHGYNTLWRAGLKSIEADLASRGKTLSSQSVLVIGNGGIARSMVQAMSERSGIVSVCGLDDQLAQRLAQQTECRFVPFQNLFETLADLVILADPKLVAGTLRGQLNPSVFRSSMTVVDVSQLPVEKSFIEEARFRGAQTIGSLEMFRLQIDAQFQAITGKPIPVGILQDTILK